MAKKSAKTLRREDAKTSQKRDEINMRRWMALFGEKFFEVDATSWFEARKSAMIHFGCGQDGLIVRPIESEIRA